MAAVVSTRDGEDAAAKQHKEQQYLDQCSAQRVSPNSEVRGILRRGEGESVRCLDFSKNYLGDLGSRCFFACLRLLPHLSELNLRSNGLRDEAICYLCSAVAQHPSLGSLDVSDNEVNDGRGGRALLHLATENILIVKLRCANTRLSDKMRRNIDATVMSNCRNEPKNLRKHAYETVTGH